MTVIPDLARHPGTGSEGTEPAVSRNFASRFPDDGCGARPGWQRR